MQAAQMWPWPPSLRAQNDAERKAAAATKAAAEAGEAGVNMS